MAFFDYFLLLVRIYTLIIGSFQGLLPVSTSMIPIEDHRFCWRHLHQNFKKLFNSKNLKDIMWNTAKATTATEFTKMMNKMKEKDEAAYNWLMNVDTFH